MNGTASNMCMTCTNRISVSGEAGTLTEALATRHREERWVTVASSKENGHKHEADVCRACVEKIARESDLVATSQKAVRHVLGRISEDPDTQHVMGFASQSLALLCQARAAMGDVPETATQIRDYVLDGPGRTGVSTKGRLDAIVKAIRWASEHDESFDDLVDDIDRICEAGWRPE